MIYFFGRYFATQFHRVTLILEHADLIDLLQNHSTLFPQLERRKYLAVKALQIFSQVK